MHPWIVKHISFPIWELKNGISITRYRRDLENSQWYADEPLRELQWAKLEKLLHHCYENVPYYRSLFNTHGLKLTDFNAPEDMKKIPVLKKSIIQNNFEQFQAQDLHRSFNVRQSSGSTAMPLVTHLDKQALGMQIAIQDRGRSWWGWCFGDKFVSLRGTLQKDNFIQRIRDVLVCNRLLIRGVDMKKESTMAFLSRLEKFGPKFMYGWANGLYTLAQIYRDSNIDPVPIDLQGICSTAEILFDYKKQFIESVFGCPVFNEYGCAEVGVISFQCPEGNMHLSSENVFTEFVRNGDGHYPESYSDIIVTDLNNYVMPLIRYKTGDLGSQKLEHCVCGRGLPLMNLSVGRDIDIVVLKNGNRYHPAIFAFIIGQAISMFDLAIRRWKVIQKRLNLFVVRIETDMAFQLSVIDHFRSSFRNRFGNDVMVEFDFVDQIPDEKSGKFREFVSEVAETEME